MPQEKGRLLELEGRQTMAHAADHSIRSAATASRQFGNPGTREVDEEYDPKRSCRTCVNLVHKDDPYGCGLDLLGGTYASLGSLGSPRPKNVAAACKSYSKGDRTPREEG